MANPATERSRTFRAKRRAWLDELKKGHVCSRCGGHFPPPVLVYHHPDPSAKLFTVGSALSNWPGDDKVLAEIDKCVLLCRNCHGCLHYEMDQAALKRGETQND